MEGEVVSFNFRNTDFSFFVNNPGEHIQRFHIKGKFYEIEELDLIARYINPGSRILEVGANIGNHVVYYAKFLSPAKITCVEPNKVAYDILKKNLELNKIQAEVELYLNIGLSDVETQVKMEMHMMNIGGARAIEDAAGSIKLMRGDDLFAGENFDFIKLDTEIQDIEALRGLEKTIAENKPLIFVEVFDHRVEELTKFLSFVNYEVLATTKMYELNTNYLIKPKHS